MVNQNRTTIQTIAESGEHLAATQAQNILNQVDSVIYLPSFNLPNLDNPEGLVISTQNNQNKTFDIQNTALTIIPNPTKSQAIFAFELPKEKESGNLIISDLNGKIVQQLPLRQNKGEVNWNTGYLESGIYVVRLQTRNEILMTKKLVIIK